MRRAAKQEKAQGGGASGGMSEGGELALEERLGRESSKRSSRWSRAICAWEGVVGDRLHGRANNPWKSGDNCRENSIRGEGVGALVEIGREEGPTDVDRPFPPRDGAPPRDPSPLILQTALEGLDDYEEAANQPLQNLFLAKQLLRMCQAV